MIFEPFKLCVDHIHQSMTAPPVRQMDEKNGPGSKANLALSELLQSSNV